MGAAGRDFHNYNILYRNNTDYEVVAFTATQIPGIAGRKYPPELAGPLYPQGIPIMSENELPQIIKKYNVDEAVFSYSDVLYNDIMHKSSIVLSSGANFKLIAPEKTMIKSIKPIIAVTASRTGAGKSTVSRKLVSLLREEGIHIVVVRHPMPYGDLLNSIVIRLEKLEDLDRLNLTIEEKEEFEHYMKMGIVAYEGVDYEKILKKAESEADIIIWDGGNNDTPFYKPDLYITVVDPTRPGHETGSYPGEINVMMADLIVISKINTAKPDDIDTVEKNVRKLNPKATIVKAKFEISVDNPQMIKGKKVVVVEDGPSVTHGHMPFGAGYIAAKQYGASEIVDPKPYAQGIFKEIYEMYKHTADVVPTIGYGAEQMKQLQEFINKIPGDTVILGTPSDISRYLKLNKPVVHVKYEMVDVGEPNFSSIIKQWITRKIKKAKLISSLS